ncbi:MAG: OPT/YSL family transporter [Planctomycetes bacterium]|nr:OPT/YSL family transporter [Planctomycetota bacterium]
MPDNSRLPLQNGLTSRTWPVIIYGAFILMPANIYLMLVSGRSLLGPISFIALILWVELARLMDKPLSRAEAFIVYTVSSIAAGQMLFYNYALFPAFFRRSEQAAQFVAVLKDGTQKPFNELAPAWWAPAADVVAQRSFFHSAWVVPILVALLVWIFHVMADISMALLGRQLFIRVEKLPFPFAQPTAAACNTLTGADPKDLKSFTVSGVVGTLWGILVYFPLALGKKIVNYPIPWIDLNPRLHTIMPGSSFGIATDILAFSGGFVIPFRVIVSMLVGAVAVQFFGNFLMVRAGVFTRYAQGMTIATTHVNEVYVWASPIIGAMVAAGLLHILSHPRQLIRAFRQLGGTGKSLAASSRESTEEAEEERPVSFKVLLGVFFSAIVGSVVLFKILIPDFPAVFIAFFAVFWSLTFSLIDMRAVGTTGFLIDPPYVREGLIIGHNRFFGYSNPDVWFAPWPVALGSSGWLSGFKVCDLVRCRVWSFIKAALIAVPVGMLANFIYMGMFWKIAPIPSSAYPYANIWLPRNTVMLSAFIGSTVKTTGGTSAAISNMFRPSWIGYTLLIFTVIHVISEYILPLVSPRLKDKGPSLIGLAVGMSMPIPFAVSLFIGGLIALWTKKRWGNEWFQSNRYIIVAGLAVGEGVMVGIFAAIAALRNSLMSQPF